MIWTENNLRIRLEEVEDELNDAINLIEKLNLEKEDLLIELNLSTKPNYSIERPND